MRKESVVQALQLPEAELAARRFLVGSAGEIVPPDSLPNPFGEVGATATSGFEEEEAARRRLDKVGECINEVTEMRFLWACLGGMASQFGSGSGPLPRKPL